MPGAKDHLPAMLEQERHRAIGTKIAAVFGKGMAHVGHGTRLVVGHAIHHHRRAVDAVAFVAQLHIFHAFQFTAAAFDGALDVVLRHVVLIGLFHRQAQARIAGRIAVAHPGRHGDFLDQARENLAALGILLAFAMLNVCPFTMTGHLVSPLVASHSPNAAGICIKKVA